MFELHHVEWSHPIFGPISETACSSHLKEVLAALGVLGVPHNFSPERERPACDRCFHYGINPHLWLPGRVQPWQPSHRT